MADDIGARIVLEGEKEFKNALKEIDAGLKVNKSELEMVAAQYERTGTSVEALTSKNSILEKVIESQKDKVSALAQGLQMAGEKYGEAGARTLKLQEDLNKANAVLYKFTNQLEENKVAISDAEEATKEHGKEVAHLEEDYKKAENGAMSFADIVKASAIGNLIASGIKQGISALLEFAAVGAESAEQFETNQSKLDQVMRNTIKASEDQIESIKELIAVEEQLGVVSQNSQTAAVQELATYTTKTQSLEKLIPVMNNMIAQQFGVNASQESAITVATMLGKVLDGQTGALSRWGYSFTDAQQRILEGNNELRKLSTIAEVVNSSVGDMNYTLAQTTGAGEEFHAALQLESIQREFGNNVDSIKDSIMISLLPSIAEAVGVINTYVTENGEVLSNLGTILATVINGLTILLKIVLSIPAPVLLLVGGLLLAVKTFTSASTGLTVLAKATGGMSGMLDPFTIKILAVVAAISVLLFLIIALKEGTDKAANSMSNLSNTAGNMANSNVGSARRGYATGTLNALKGKHWVGENGPEIVDFGGGERVYTAAQSARMASELGVSELGETYNDHRNMPITVNGIHELNELVDWWKSKQRRERAMGMEG